MAANTKTTEATIEHDYSINGVQPINQQDMTTCSAEELEQQALSQNRPNWFQPGNTHGVGQRRGKQKLSKQFVSDLQHEWASRGCQALADLSSLELVKTVGNALPRDLLLSMNDSEAARWVISAAPALSSDEWASKHAPVTVEQDSQENQEDTAE